jgi:hypothetical protein
MYHLQSPIWYDLRGGSVTAAGHTDAFGDDMEEKSWRDFVEREH